MTNNSALIGSVKFFNIVKDFGFITVGTADYHFNLAIVEAAGFAADNMKDGVIVEFIPTKLNGKDRVDSIKRVGLDQAQPKKATAKKMQKPKTPKPKKVSKSNQRSKRTWNFYSRTKVDCNNGVGLFKVAEVKTGAFHQYVTIELVDGKEAVRPLGNISLPEARLAIGHVITPPIPKNAGVPTNDPSLSQAMKGGASSSQKKAA